MSMIFTSVNTELQAFLGVLRVLRDNLPQITLTLPRICIPPAMQGIIHRDIKPSNLLLCKSVHRPICKLTDFGAAIPFDMLQSSNSCIGTPAFMAPEQMEGDTGYYSDVWAIGVTALFLSTGSLPYEFSAGMTSAQVCAATRNPVGARNAVDAWPGDVNTEI